MMSKNIVPIFTKNPFHSFLSLISYMFSFNIILIKYNYNDGKYAHFADNSEKLHRNVNQIRSKKTIHRRVHSKLTTGKKFSMLRGNFWHNQMRRCVLRIPYVHGVSYSGRQSCCVRNYVTSQKQKQQWKFSILISDLTVGLKRDYYNTFSPVFTITWTHIN